MAALAACAALCARAPSAEAIPFGQRLTLRGELTLGHVVGSAQSQYFSFGTFISGRAGVSLAGPVSLQLTGGIGVFPSQVIATSITNTWFAGLRAEPRTVRPEGRLFVDVNAGLVVTGPDYRPGFDVGFGWDLAVSRYLYLGPVFRYSHVIQPDRSFRSDDGNADAHYVSFGLSLAIRPFPPPRPRGGTFFAVNPENAPDTDYDGVPDYADQCPEAVEDHDGFQDEDGCPDLDDDGDNLPDSEDRCPRASETPNGFDDEDGCPDDLPATTEAITLTGDQLRLRQRVYFSVERVQVPPLVMPTLVAMARFLAEHTEIRRVRVEGHADDRGTRRHGFELSLRRAINVVAFLVDQGIDRSRLEAVGLGDLRPLELPHDEVTRARNRRIDFVIADGPAGRAQPPPEGTWTPATHPLTDFPTAPPASAP